jgi:hypothetical protein
MCWYSLLRVRRSHRGNRSSSQRHASGPRCCALSPLPSEGSTLPDANRLIFSLLWAPLMRRRTNSRSRQWNRQVPLRLDGQARPRLTQQGPASRTKAFAAFLPPTPNHIPPADRRHARKETMIAFPLDNGRLKSPLHSDLLNAKAKFVPMGTVTQRCDIIESSGGRVKRTVKCGTDSWDPGRTLLTRP